MLCERTAGMLGNLMGAEEQERMLNDMKLMQEKSKQTSDELLNMVKELSVITESSMQANESIALEAGNILQSFSENTESMDDINIKTQDINNKLIELAKMNSELARLSVKVAETTKVNQSKMDDATSRMQQINESTNECRDIIWELGEKSKEILGITQVITGISNQTNILALNASIEAARAGEHGKGFAVVADQIRKLAEDSAVSATKTKQLISKSISEVQKGNEITSQTAEALDSVIEKMDNIVLAVAHIRKASDKQAASVKEIEKGFEGISAVVQNNSAAAEETSATSEELSAQAVALKGMVEHFQLREN